LPALLSHLFTENWNSKSGRISKYENILYSLKFQMPSFHRVIKSVLCGKCVTLYTVIKHVIQRKNYGHIFIREEN